jgi:hypothetical protein
MCQCGRRESRDPTFCTASAGHRHSDVEIRDYLQDAASRWNLPSSTCPSPAIDTGVATLQQNGLLTHPRNLDAPLRVAALCSDN